MELKSKANKDVVSPCLWELVEGFFPHLLLLALRQMTVKTNLFHYVCEETEFSSAQFLLDSVAGFFFLY